MFSSWRPVSMDFLACYLRNLEIFEIFPVLSQTTSHLIGTAHIQATFDL